MKKLSEINESLWMDSIKRANSDLVRKEDDISKYDMNDMVDYIESKYELFKDITTSVSADTTTFSLVILKFGGYYYYMNTIYRDEIIDRLHILANFEVIGNNCIDKMKEKYNVEKTSMNTVIIRQKDKQIPNQFLIDVIDLIIKYSENAVIKKKL